MSDNTSKQSVRQLPPGKLENLLKRFEDAGDSKDSSSAKGERHNPPPRPPQPPTRVKSPERPSLPAGKKPQLSPQQKRLHAKQSLPLPPQPPPKGSNNTPAVRKISAGTASVSRDERQQEVSQAVKHNASPPLGKSKFATDSNGTPPKPQPPAKPAVHRKPSNVSDASHNVIDNPVYGGFPQKDQTAIADLYSKVNKTTKKTSDSPKPVSSDQEHANIHRREAVRKNSGERRKTVASFDSEAAAVSGSEGVSVAMRTKLFDAQNAGKPVPPKKTEAVRSMSMRASRKPEQILDKPAVTNTNGSEELYDPPWDSTKSAAVEKLKQSHQAQQSASDPPSHLNKANKGKPPPLPSQPPPKTPGPKKNISDSIKKSPPNASPPKPPHVIATGKDPPAKPFHVAPAPNACPPKPPHLGPTSKDSPAKAMPAAPPPKPPRTHVHDNYLINKISKEPEPRDQQPAPKAVSIVEPDGEEVEYFSVKDRLAKLMQTQKPESQTPESQSNLSTPSSSSKDQDVLLRQKPPSRPPPPKHRPNSGDSNASSSPRTPARPLTHCPETKHSHGGPIIIPVYPRGKEPKRQQQLQLQQQQHQHHVGFHRQSSATHDCRRRRPTDDLPEEPEGLRPLQRFPLRKSFSSECINSSRGSSLNLSTGGTWGDSSAGTGENYSSMSRSAHGYEAVIDPDGYAVPNEFLRLPQHGKDPQVQDQMIEASPGQFLTKLSGFEASKSTRLFSENTSKDEHKGGKVPNVRHDITKVTKKKLIMVREKINQAYAALEVAVRGQVDSEDDTWGSADMAVGSRPVSEEIVVEPTELKRRIQYCTGVRLKSTKSVKRTKEYRDVIYPQLFEYCLVVGLRPLTDLNGYEPFLIHKFPENQKYKMGTDGSILLPSLEVSSNLSVPSFCFPDASIFKPGSAPSVSESYSFVMTYADGSRVYGYCRRMQPPDCSLPEVICIISPIDAFNMYNTLLTEIEQRRRVSSDLALEVIAASFGRPLPKPGKVCHIRTLDNNGDMETIFLNRPTDNRLDDVNYESPLFYLGTDRLVKVFSSMLMERRIILCSSNLSTLTQTVHALSALLYPFHWQHVYVPLLPEEMLDIVCAPMPYIVGVLSAFLPQVLQMDTEQVFIVDLDKKNIVKSQGDESTILPRKVQRALKTAINMCKIDSEAQNAQWLMVAEAFLRMFIETMGHFTSHVRTQQDGNRIFQKEGFILEMVSKELRQFLEWFTETQMFEVFIVDLVEKPDLWTSNDIFMQRLKEHRESKEENNRRKGLGAKVKNFGKALKTKLQS